MARPLRVEYADAVYHVTARGNERRSIYRDDADRERHLETIGEMAERFGVVVHAYCLMPNHYHLLLQTPRSNLSAAAGWLQTTYSIRFNRRHGRSGHLFQGRFKAHVVEADAYAAQLITYIHLNPVRPRNKRKPVPAERRDALRRYRWSSHRAYAGVGRGAEPAWLCVDWLSYFGRTVATARNAYRKRIEHAFGRVVESPWADLQHGVVLGGDELMEKVRGLLDRGTSTTAIKWRARLDGRQVAAKVAALAAKQEDHRLAIWIRVRLGGERMTDVAADYGYGDGSGVHRVVHRLEAYAKSDPSLDRTLKSLAEEVHGG